MDKKYKTSDLYFIAALLSLGKHYDNIENLNGRKVFVFSGNVENVITWNEGKVDVQKNVSLDEVESRHFSGLLYLPTNKYSAAIRNTKSLIHARR